MSSSWFRRITPTGVLTLLSYGVPAVLHVTFRWGIAFITVAIIWGIAAFVTWEPIRKRLHIENLAFVRVADWFDAKGLRVHYISSRWIEAPKELVIEASFRCNSGDMDVKDIELRVGRMRVPYKDISTLGAPTFRLPMVVGKEQTYYVSFLIPDKLQGKNHTMRLVVTAGGKRYLSEPDYLNLDYSGIFKR